MFNRNTLYAVFLCIITGCGSNSDGSSVSLGADASNPMETPDPVEPTKPVDPVDPVDPVTPITPEPVPASTLTIGLLPDTQGGSDAQGQAHVAIHPMEAVLKHQAEYGVDLVLALGDLTDNGSTARDFAGQGSHNRAAIWRTAASASRMPRPVHSANLAHTVAGV